MHLEVPTGLSNTGLLYLNVFAVETLPLSREAMPKKPQAQVYCGEVVLRNVVPVFDRPTSSQSDTAGCNSLSLPVLWDSCFYHQPL